ncbi:uncharacterized protein LOC143292755 isoform X2 [Babylonia areolata]|uniref:uncharacterized protein LOC143292755 isoform X2 n=1 Tax=Babylonia areolata TaxID=304850 RepID=UPI003FD11B3C
MGSFILFCLMLQVAAVFGSAHGGINPWRMMNHPVVHFAERKIREHLNQNTVVDRVLSASMQATYHLNLRMSGNYDCTMTISTNHIGPFEVQSGPECRGEQMPGGISEEQALPTDDESVLDSLDAAVCAVSKHIGNNSREKAYKIASTSGVTYTSQATAGMTYRFYNVPLVETTCTNDHCDRDYLSRCSVRMCHLRVQHTPWNRDQPFNVFKAEGDPCLSNV